MKIKPHHNVQFNALHFFHKAVSSGIMHPNTILKLKSLGTNVWITVFFIEMFKSVKQPHEVWLKQKSQRYDL